MRDSDSHVDRRTVIGGIGAGLVGMAGSSTIGSVAAQEGSITVTGVWEGGEQEDFMAVVDYVQDETDLEISYEPRTTDDILTGTLLDYEAGTTPADVVMMPSPARIRTDAENGHLEALGDAWDEESYAPDPEQVSVDGEVYAAPFKMDVKPGFWYRQSFFEDNDLEEPESYDEFLDLLDEIDGIEGVDAPLASGNGDGWPLSDQMEAYILQQEDGAQLQQDLITGDAEFADDRVVSAFEEVQSLLQDDYFSELRDFGVQFEFFWENQTPLYFQGSFTPGFEAIQEPEDLGFFRLPETEGVVSSVSWFTVPTYGENVEAARAAVEEFLQPEAQQVWAERGGFIASSTEVPDEAYELDVMLQISELAAEVDLVPDLDDALGDPFQSEFWSQLTGLWSDPDQDVQTMVERLDEVHQETVEGDDTQAADDAADGNETDAVDGNETDAVDGNETDAVDGNETDAVDGNETAGDE